jgi:hypothetical protein
MARIVLTHRSYVFLLNYNNKISDMNVGRQPRKVSIILCKLSQYSAGFGKHYC